jgi:hypothetical protein
MKQKRTKKTDIYTLGRTLGLSNRTIKTVLNQTPQGNEQTKFSFGPPHYGGGYYGTISINDFE